MSNGKKNRNREGVDSVGGQQIIMNCKIMIDLQDQACWQAINDDEWWAYVD